MKLVPRERVQQRIAEQIVEVLVPQIMEDIVEEFKNCTTGAILSKDL